MSVQINRAFSKPSINDWNKRARMQNGVFHFTSLIRDQNSGDSTRPQSECDDADNGVLSFQFEFQNFQNPASLVETLTIAINVSKRRMD
jgi:hypothetical protein